MSDCNNEVISGAIDLLINKGVDLSSTLSEDGLLKQLTKRLLEKALESTLQTQFNKTFLLVNFPKLLLTHAIIGTS